MVKKIVAFMLTVLLILNSISFVVSATSYEVEEITAGAQSVSVIFTEDIETAGVTVESLDITLTTDDGVAFPYTTSINGDTLTIIPTHEFTRDTESYLLTVEGVTRIIKVKTLWTPEFKVENDAVTGLKYDPTASYKSAIDVVDENTVVMGGDYGAFIYPDYEEIKNYENASMVADIYYTGRTSQQACANIGFNMPSISNSSWNTQMAFWKTDEVSNYRHVRMVGLGGGNAARYVNVAPITDADLQIYDYKTYNGDVKLGSTVLSANSVAGTYTLPANFYENATKYRYVVDKDKTVGSLIMNGALIDKYDLKYYYDKYNTTNGTSYAAPEKGYFILSPGHMNYKIVVSNLALVTTSVIEYKAGDLKLTSAGTLSGNRKSFEIEFADDITSVTNETVKEYIKVTKLGENVTYTYTINGNKMTIKPEDGIIPNQQYDIVVLAGFGYENYTVKTNTNLDYTYYKPELNVKNITAGAQSVSVIFTEDIESAEVLAEDIAIALTDDENKALSYTTLISGDTLTIIPTQEFVRDTESYIITVEGVTKLINVKTLWTPEFKVENDAVAGLKYVVDSSYKAAIDVVDENTVVMGANYGTFIYPDYDDIKNYENASMLADVYYTGAQNGQACSVLGFNVDSLRHSNWNRQSSFWKTNEPAGAKHVRMVGMGTTAAKYVDVAPETDVDLQVYNYKANNDAVILGSAVPTTNCTVGTYTLPANFYENATKYRYVVDKDKTVGSLIMNGILVDKYDLNDYYNEYNTTNSTSYVAPEKGYFILAPAHEKYKIVVSNMALVKTTVDDIINGGLDIVNNSYSIGADGKIEGTLKLRNYGEDDKNAAVVAIVYDNNAEFIGAVKVIDQKIPSGQIVGQEFIIDTDATAANVEFVLFDENTKTPCVETNDIIKSDYENDTIKVSGKVEKSDKEQYVYMLLTKDGTFTDEWTGTSKADGDFRMIEIPADTEEFEYEFKYEAGEDDVYPMSLYQINWDNKVSTNKIDTYNYAGKNAINSYIESLKSTKTTFAELLKYAQSMGIDVKYADTPSKQDILVETLYTERENITSKENVLALISTAKARALLISDIKVKGITVALVNELISKYKTDAKLDTSKYDALSVEQKYAICKMFLKANYEETGYEAFVLAFNKAVENPPVIGGATTGDAVVKPNVTPVMGAASAGVQEVDKTDAVDAPVVSGNFSDLKDYSWAEESINYLAKKGVISGIGNNQFNPEGTVTREQLAKMIVLAFEKYNGDAKNTFADVSSDNWSATYIASAKANGLIKGVSENEFAPLSAVTREDIAVILYRATVLAGKTYSAKKDTFTDFDNVSDYAKEAVAYMAGTGIINGFEDGSFNPKAPATRAQAAKLIYEALGKGE